MHFLSLRHMMERRQSDLDATLPPNVAITKSSGKPKEKAIESEVPGELEGAAEEGAARAQAEAARGRRRAGDPRTDVSDRPQPDLHTPVKA